MVLDGKSRGYLKTHRSGSTVTELSILDQISIVTTMVLRLGKAHTMKTEGQSQCDQESLKALPH